jgi:hypothetical protein
MGDRDLDAILREHGGLEGLAAEIGQTDAREYSRQDDVGRSAPGKPVGLGFLRKVFASLAARLGRTSNPVGTEHIKRQATAVRALHGLPPQRRNPSTPQLGRR